MRVVGGHLVVRTEIEAADGSHLAPLEVRVAVDQADLLDPTATPGVAPLVVLAAARGEDLHIHGPVDARLAEGAARLMGVLVERWGLPPLTVRIDDVYDAPPGADAIGLVFSDGVDSWSTLLELLDEAPGDRVTHLVSVSGASSAGSAASVDLRSIAAELGLEVVEVQSTALALIESHHRSADGEALALVGAGLQVAGRMRRLVLTADCGVASELIGSAGTGRTELVVGGEGQTRGERIARIVGSPQARRAIRVCEAEGAAQNCGRCIPCSITMAELALAGDADPASGFAARLDPDHIRHLLLGPEVGPQLTSIIEGLPPAHEEVRRAWSDAWEKSNGVTPRVRWGDDAPPALAGASVPQRVAAALRATTGQPVAPAPVPLGWRAGTVPLRPTLERHEEIRALADANAGRPHAWAVVEHHIRDEARDGHQAELALALAEHHGPGPTYLPGILWAWLEPPVLDAVAVQVLLRTARARLWWRAVGDLEPLRVLEAIEQGCLPLQVMPADTARGLARDLPPALAPLVVPEDSLADLDLGPESVARLLDPVVDHLLAGSAEFDLLTGAYS